MTLLRPLACAIALFTAATVTPISTAQAHTRVHHHHVRAASHHRHRHCRARPYAPISHFFAPASAAINTALHYLGQGNPTGTRRPWCGDFQNLLEHKAGRPGVGSGLASAWVHYGHASGPVPGAIVVFRGHVGRVLSRVGNQIRVISGNYGHRVGIGLYAIRSAIAFRMP